MRESKKCEIIITSRRGGPAQKPTDPLLKDIENARFLASNVGLYSFDDAGCIEGNHNSQADTEKKQKQQQDGLEARVKLVRHI